MDRKGVEDYIRLQLVPYWLLRITTNIILHYTLPYYDVLKYNVTAQMIRLLELLGMLSITSHTKTSVKNKLISFHLDSI